MLAFAGGVYWQLRAFLENRDVSSKLLALASKEFFDNAEKIMKTPEDVPDTVLDALKTMNDTMNNGEGSRALLHILREFNKQKAGALKQENNLAVELGKMREPLRDLFGMAVAGWLNYVTHRHFLYSRAINSELRKMAVREKHPDINSAQAGISLLPRFPTTA
jgi:hypothetical protein